MNDTSGWIAVSAADLRGLDAVVSAHFGRCPGFTLVRLDGRDVAEQRVVENPYAAHHAPGEVPRFLHELGATAVLSGGMGRRALEAFAEHGIAASVGHTGSAREAIEAYLASGAHSGEPCAGRHGSGPCHEDAPAGGPP